MNKQNARRKFPRLSQNRWFGAAFAAVGLTVASIVWYRHLNARPDFHLSFPPMPSGPNAYDDFARAAKLAETLPGRDSDPQADWSPRQVPVILAQDEEAKRALLAGFGHSYRDKGLFTQSQTSQTQEPGYYNNLSALAQMLTYETQERSERGDTSGALESSMIGIQMGATLPNGSGLTGRHNGICCEILSRSALWPIVDRLNVEQAADILKGLEKIDAQRDSLADSFRREEQRGLVLRYDLISHGNLRDTYQSLYTRDISGLIDRNTGQDSAHAKGVLSPRLRDWLTIASMNRKQFVDNYVAWMHTRTDALSLPYSNAPTTLSGLDPLNCLLEMEKDGFSTNFTLEPRYDDAHNQVGNRLLELSLALHVYRLRTGAYPKSLEMLVSSGILRTIPSDPFARRINTPFEYHALAAGDYRLSSVGPDGRDQRSWTVGAHFQAGEVTN